MTRDSVGVVAQRLIISVAVLLVATSVSAGPIVFADTFDQEQLGLNYTTFQKWIVTAGTVDVVGTGFYNYLCDGGPSPARCVDLDGSTNRAGTLQSKPISLVAGDYVLRFWLRGNDRGYPADTLNVSMSLGNLYAETFVYASSVPWTEIVRSFNYAGPDQDVSLTFALNGGDNQGIILDNVELQAVPEPASLTFLATGVLGLLAGRRRRR